MKKENSELKTSVSTLEQLLCLKEDVYKQLEFANDKNERLLVERENLRRNVDETTDQLMSKDDLLYERSKMIEKMKNLLNEKEEVKKK